MDRFIVGTGRCGSTLLSRMLAEQPSLRMIFEFFSGLDLATRFQQGVVSGADFAALLARDTPALTMVMERGYQIAEVVYPYRSDSRYRREQPIPWILAAALSRMSHEPDALFDACLARAAAQPSQTLAGHYRAIFDWLTQRSGRRVWIEKSGSSIEYLATLRDFFPEARFLHLHRDGREAALSMREHHVYRLWVSLLYGEGGAEVLAVGPSPDGRDRIREMLESPPPVEHFGRYWSDLTVRGFRALGRLDAVQYQELCFEDLVADPATHLGRIADFFEIEARDESWVSRAADLVLGIPPTRFGSLSPDEQSRLEEACRPGRMLLGQVE